MAKEGSGHGRMRNTVNSLVLVARVCVCVCVIDGCELRFIQPISSDLGVTTIK